MVCRAFRLYSFAYLFSGFSIIGSSFFTALNNGFVSALISFVRTLIFEIVAVLALPIFLGLDGVWLSGVVAELSAFFVTASCAIACRKRYGYL